MSELVVRPDAREFLVSLGDTDAALGQTSIPDMRAMKLTLRDTFDVPVGELAVNRPCVAETPSGPVPLRLFDCRGEREPGPIMIFLHGGGFYGGSAEYYSSFCAEATRALDMPVVAVGADERGQHDPRSRT